VDSNTDSKNNKLLSAKGIQKSSIATKFIKYIVALIFVIILSLVISIKSQEKVYNENFEDSIQFTSEIIGESVKNALIIQYYSFLTHLMELLVKEPDIVYVIIVSDDNRIMESTIEAFNGKHVKELGDKFSLSAANDTNTKLRKAKDPYFRKKLVEDKRDIIKEIEALNKQYTDLRLIFTVDQVKEELETKLKEQNKLEHDLDDFYSRRQNYLNDREYKEIEKIDSEIGSINKKIDNIKEYINALEKIKTLIKEREKKESLIKKMVADNEIYEVSVPLIGTGKEKYGSIRIGFSPKRGKERIRMIYLKSIFTGIFLVVFGLAISLYLARTITRPIQELSKGAEILGSGNLNHRITIKTGNEIEMLAESLNDMASKLNESYSSLEQKVQERTREYLDATKELQRAYKKLQATQAQLIHSEKMTSLGQLVAGVAHELNNPIGFIYGNMKPLTNYINNIIKLIEFYQTVHLEQEDQNKVDYFLKENDFEFLLEDLEDLIADIREGAERAQKIVLDLRNFSRLDEAEYKEVDIHQGIDSTLNLLVNKYKHRIRLHKNYSEIPLINCYASQLNQVWMNLLVNAAQAIDEEGDVYIRTGLEDEYVIIEIKDTGKGIPPEVKEKIFDPFFTTKPVGEGTGLGLSITHSIIKKHNGLIEIESEIGKGTTFTVKLPLKRDYEPDENENNSDNKEDG
jgi:signal transduction histidine kinase